MVQFDAITTEPEVEVLSGLADLSVNLTSSIQVLGETIEANAAAIDEFHRKNVEQQSEFATQLSKLDFGTAISKLNDLAEAMGSAKSGINALVETSSNVDIELNNIGSSLSESNKRITKSHEQLEKVTELGEQLTRTQTAVVTLQSDAETLSEKIVGQVAAGQIEIERAIETSSDRLRMAIKPIAAQISAIQVNFDEVREETSNLKQRIRRSISEVIDYLNTYK